MSDIDNGIIDTSKRKGFLQGFAELFSAATPNSGFNKLILVFFVLGLVTWWWWRTDDAEAANNLGSTTASEIVIRKPEVRVVPEAVVQEELSSDQTQATEKRAEGESYAGVRPETGKTSVKTLLDNLNKQNKAPPAPDPKPEPIAQPTVFKKPSKLDLSSARQVSNNRTRATGLQPKAAVSKPANPITAYVLERKKEKNSQTKEAEFLSGTLVEYEPKANKPAVTSSTQSQQSSPITEVSKTPGTSNGQESDQDQGTFLAQRAGHFSYAITLTGVDTDMASNEVVGEIVGGPLDSARIIGTWKRLGNWYEDLSLVFNQLEFEGDIYAVELVAFSPDTSLPGFVSEVDRHLLLRWGGLITGAVLEAAKTAAIAQSDTTRRFDDDTGDLTAIETSRLTGDDLKELFWADAGSRIAEQLKELYQRPITSRVYVGQDMRLLALKPIVIKKPL